MGVGSRAPFARPSDSCVSVHQVVLVTRAVDWTSPVYGRYRPELDVTVELDADMMSRFLQLIGILRWAVELGRIDIFHEVSILSQHQALPREGHLEAVYHIFAYLKNKDHRKYGRIGYDPSDPIVDLSERVLRGR